VSSGRVLIAPGGCNIRLARDGDAKKIHFSRKGLSRAVVPSIDYTMSSAAKAYGDSTLGVLLTGIGSDGTKGMRAIKEVGGNTIVEDQSTCVVFGMPKAAIESGCVDEVVPLPVMAKTILRMI